MSKIHSSRMPRRRRRVRPWLELLEDRTLLDAGNIARAPKHDSEECLYVMQGRLRVRLSGTDYVLNRGDSIHDLANGLNDLVPNFVSFFISFAVIGRYWLAHHKFVSLLGGMDQALIGLNLIYLAFIAFLPFPTALLGSYFENPLSIISFKAKLAK